MSHARLALLITLALPLLVACGGDSKAAAAEATPRSAVPNVATLVVDSVSVTGPVAIATQLYVERDAVVAARTGGLLESLPVDIGTEIPAGGTVAQIESAAQQLAVERTSAAAETAHRAAERLRTLFAARGATGAEVEQAELAERQTRVALDDARRELALTRVVAPFAGVVTARYARAGRAVVAGDTLLRVAERGPLMARVRVPEGAAGALRAGDVATVTALGGAAASARVVRVAPAIDAASGTREIVVQLAGGASLLPGASVRVSVGREARRTLAVPLGAVRPGGYVLVVGAGGAVLRSVALGDTLDGGRVEIVRGLAAGERVALGK